MLQEQILLFLVVFGAADPGDPRGACARRQGRATLAVRSSEVAAAGVGHHGQPVEGPDLRPVGRDRRHRWRAARHVLVRSSPTRPRRVLAWAHLAGARGDLRHPPPRRRPARRLRVRRRHRRVPLDLVVVVPERRRRAGADHVHLLHPDPLGPRRDPARAGARRHPLARRPAEAPQEAREGPARLASPRPRRRRTAARSRSTSVQHRPRTRRPASRDGRRPPVGADVAEAAFAVRGVVAGYGDAEVLHGVDLRVERGKVTALLGANGAGKSTLCSVAAGIVEASLGAVYLEGDGDHRHRAVPARPRRRPARARGARHLPRPDRGGEPHRAPARRRSSARTPTSASRSSPNGASRWPACSPAASSRC